MTTVYTIRNNGIEYQTTDSDEAEDLSNRGAHVKATHYVEDVKQTDEDKGTLIISGEPNWIESSPMIMADANAWVFTEGWE